MWRLSRPDSETPIRRLALAVHVQGTTEADRAAADLLGDGLMTIGSSLHGAGASDGRS
jgi:hypothetical protein